jgi:CheY-like chemotaxis protein
MVESRAKTHSKLGHNGCFDLAVRRTDVTATHPQILVVAPTHVLADSFRTWLGQAGYDVTVVATFAAGKKKLRAIPDLLITEVRLNDYNGLHLALYAYNDGVPAIVVGAADPVLESEAGNLGAAFLHGEDVSRETTLAAITSRLSAAPRREHTAPLADAVAPGIASNIEWVVAPALHRAPPAVSRPTLH